MSYYDYDPESTIQDADIEMLELEQAAAQEVCDRADGNCHHTSSGPAHSPEHPGQFECYHCGRKFKDRAERDRLADSDLR